MRFNINITQTHVNTLIEERYRERGKAYFEERMVEILSLSETKVSAKCLGSRLYKAELVMKGNQLSGQCSCPAFEDFGPCKHLAALCYAVMAKKTGGYKTSADYFEEAEEITAIEKHLMKKSKAELVALLMQVYGDDPNLRWTLAREMNE